MTVPWFSIRLMQRTVNLWLFGYLVSTLGAAEWLGVHPAVSALPPPPGALSMVTHVFAVLPSEWAIGAVLLVMLLALRSVILPTRWYFTAVQWVLFSSLVNFSWLTANGGHQLIANVLFWMIFLPGQQPTNSTAGAPTRLSIIHASAVWIIRLQLLLAYGVTAIQKLTGNWWPSGEALGIVASDPGYGPAWVAQVPVLAVALNHVVLAFQLTLPLAIWWRATRVIWLVFGVFFHLYTGVAFGILDMGLAFLAVYPIWSRAGEERLRG
ncbi:MAG: HTTM domain-containing protein [Flavobacteriales bacterium]